MVGTNRLSKRTARMGKGCGVETGCEPQRLREKSTCLEPRETFQILEGQRQSQRTGRVGRKPEFCGLCNSDLFLNETWT
jgi:hypothetical protein